MSLFMPLVLATVATSSVRLMPFFPDREFPAAGEEVVVEFPNVEPGIPFDEVVPSWNVSPAEGASLEIRLRSRGEGFESKWYSFGKWSMDEAAERTSIEGQKDDHGNVLTDTFVPRKAAKAVDVQVTLRNTGDGPRPRLKLFTLSFLNSKSKVASGATPSPAWGKTIEVPQRAQGNYPNGGVLCSPTALSMVLWHHANQLNRPELNKDVPEIVACVWDKTYDGAGNWSFNAAYAGSFPGIRSYVTRLRHIGDLERWIEAGIPVICSISLNLARGLPKDGNTGHLVVLVGFTKDGDPVFNDPARKAQVRQTYKRENFEKAWLHSNRTVYVVHPEDALVPDGPEGAWIGK